MTRDDLSAQYQGYIACLNGQDWDRLHLFVGEDVRYNGTRIGLAGYRAILVGDFAAIPDLRFNPVTVICEPPVLACRLAFDCTPVGMLFDLPINGRRVRFGENVFYTFDGGRIAQVHSVIDKAAIAAQL